MDSMDPDSINAEEPGFVKRIFLIPCLSKTLMYAISGGTGVFLGHFLFTSNVPKAGKSATLAYFTVFFGTWGVCRYNLAQKRFAEHQWQRAIEDKSGESSYKKINPKDV